MFSLFCVRFHFSELFKRSKLRVKAVRVADAGKHQSTVMRNTSAAAMKQGEGGCNTPVHWLSWKNKYVFQVML